MTVLTIPKNFAQKGELVIIPRKEFEALMVRANDAAVSETDVLRWSREARQLKRAGKLAVLRSLRAL